MGGNPEYGGNPVGSGVTLTYSFPGVAPAHADGYNEFLTGYSPLNAEQQVGAQAALQAWANVANISLTLMADTPSDVGDIRAAACAQATSLLSIQVASIEMAYQTIKSG